MQANYPPDSYSTTAAPTLEDILAGRVAMTVLDYVNHGAPILEADWNGNDWSDDAWVPREYQYWIAMGDHSEELAEVAPELLDYSNFDGWDSPVALPFDTIQCSAYSYTMYYSDANHEPVSPLIGTTIKSFLFPKNDTHPFPVILDGIQDVLDAYEPEADEGYLHDSQAMCWHNMDNELPGGCGVFYTVEGDDLSEPFSETKSYYESIRDSGLNVLGLTVYSDPVEQTSVIYSSPI